MENFANVNAVSFHCFPLMPALWVNVNRLSVCAINNEKLSPQRQRHLEQSNATGHRGVQGTDPSVLGN